MVTSIIHNELKLATIVEQPEIDGPNPMVILLHGFTGRKEEKHIETVAMNLVSEGFIAVRFDAPGSGESEGTWEDDYRVSNYIDSVKTVYEWAVENLDVDTSRVGIWSHSMGGAVALQVVCNWPDLFAAICCSQPSTGKSATLRGDEVDKGAWVDSSFGRIYFPKEYYIDKQRYNSAEAAGELTIPQLYIAGTKDTLVPKSAVEKIYQNANGPKKLEVFETDHFYKNDAVMLDEINQVTVSFFKETLL